MSHFAEIDADNTVLRILTTPDDEEEVNRGAEYLADDLGLGGTWIQTFNDRSGGIRHAEVGGTYDSDLEIFIGIKPHPSWILDADTTDWVPPVALPADHDTVPYVWDEDTVSWVEIEVE
ncbi:MAG: hypothetical protein CL612_03735 [Anaerolineaceae bacterium]|jgi:hypothetical protein|nr:hypothetical protein [Anaerolineaceae bacterium]